MSDQATIGRWRIRFGILALLLLFCLCSYYQSNKTVDPSIVKRYAVPVEESEVDARSLQFLPTGWVEISRSDRFWLMLLVNLSQREPFEPMHPEDPERLIYTNRVYDFIDKNGTTTHRLFIYYHEWFSPLLHDNGYRVAVAEMKDGELGEYRWLPFASYVISNRGGILIRKSRLVH